jgi:hypothetical protein
VPGGWGGSKPEKAPNKKRDFGAADALLCQHYFSGPEAIYDEIDFERRFRMPRTVFNRLLNGVTGRGKFIQHQQLIGPPGITPLLRLVACLRIICNGTAADAQDEHYQIGESTALMSLKELTRHVVAVLYLNRCPNEEEKRRQEAVRKDIENAFEILVKRFGILKQRLRFWEVEDIKYLLYTCVILHNMITEARRPHFNAAVRGMDVIEENDDVQPGGQPAVSLSSLGGPPPGPQDGPNPLALRVAAMSENL